MQETSGRARFRYPGFAALLVAAALVALLVAGGSSSRARVALGPVGRAIDDVGDWFEDRFEKRRDDPRTSPFEEVEWKEGRPRVKVEGAWYALESVDGWPIDDLLAHITEKHGRERLEKRFEEDLPMVLREGWKEPAAEVVLKLRGDDGAVVDRKTLMTEANRRRHWERRGKLAAAPVVVAVATAMTKADAERVLDEVVAVLCAQHSYSVLRGVPGRCVIAAKDSLPEAPTLDDVVHAAMMVVAASGDGHAGVEGGTERGPWFDALLIPIGFAAGDAVIGVRPDRRRFIDPERPRVLAIDGKGIEEWIGVASVEVPAASPQLVRERSLRLLRSLPKFRDRLGLPAEKALTLTLASMDGSKAQDMTVALTATRPVFGAWPRRESGWIEGSPGRRVGYVRLAEMRDGPGLAKLTRELGEFAATDRLILDVRGNGGGVRDPIGVLANLLLTEEDGAIVYNASRQLILHDEDATTADERAASRFLFPGDSSLWTGAERRAIKAFAAGFTPEVQVPADRFTGWYYAVARKTDDSPVYKGRLVVLMDERCFSATDVCLAALREFGRARERAGLPGITLMGQPSAGGSGLAREVAVKGSVLKLRLSSMVSYRPDGRLFDGAGVAPDIEVLPVPTDFITVDGEAQPSDSMIERAVKHLSE